MTKAKISVRAIEAVMPADAPVFLWDIEKPGFGVKVTPAGKRVFILQYRLGGRGSKTVRYTIGPYGVWTVAAAQKEAGRLLLLIGQGVDPAREKQSSRRVATETMFGDIADLYLSERVQARTPKSYVFNESIFRLHVRPSLNGMPLPHITEDDIMDLLVKIPVQQVALRRNVFSVLRTFFKWAKSEKRIIKANPMVELDAPPAAASRDRVLDDAEMDLVWRAINALPDPFNAFGRFLLISGQRRTEVATMDWNELNQADREWIIPSEKTKNGRTHVVPLSGLAMAELDALAGSSVWPKRGLIFTSTGKVAVSGYSYVKELIDENITAIIAEEAEAAGQDVYTFKPWRFHDLRRSMATGMQRLRVAPPVIEACENRQSGESKKGSAKVYQRYAYIDEKRQAMEKWGNHLISITTKTISNVVPLASKVK